MPTDTSGDGSEVYLELVREHLAGCHEALAVRFPRWAPHLALIELPGEVDHMPVPRRRVTDLLEFQRHDALPDDDERGEQLELDLWPSPPAVELPDPGMARTVKPKAEEPGPVMVQAPLLSIRGVVPERVSARGV